MKGLVFLLALSCGACAAQEMSARVMASSPVMPAAGRAIGGAFGAELPPGVTQRDVASLVLPRATASLATLTGLKRWPQEKGLFISLVCIAPDTAAQIEAMRAANGQASCAVSAGTNLGLGLLKQDQDGKLSATSEPLSWQGAAGNPLAVSWAHSKLFGPYGINHWQDQTNAHAKEEVLMPSQLVGLDLGKYNLGPKMKAFGIRSSLDERYAGGSAHFEFLSLFAVVGGELRVVFSEPVSYLKEVLRKDGKHDVWSGAASVGVGAGRTDGMADLVVKGRGWQTVFKWNSAAMRYLAH